MAMERILQRLNMGTLIDKFQEQRMDPCTVLSPSDGELARLGISTIGDRVRLRELCKEEESDGQQEDFARVRCIFNIVLLGYTKIEAANKM